MDLGPRVVLTMSATALAALMLAYWAALPCSRLAFLFRTMIGCCILVSTKFKFTSRKNKKQFVYTPKSTFGVSGYNHMGLSIL